MKERTIHIASDHAGYEMKEFLKRVLNDKGYNPENGYSIVDHGPTQFVESDDYPDYIFPCAESVANDINSVGIILGGSGQGEAIAANKVHGIRAGVYYANNPEIAELLRKHNNANIISFGARFIKNEEALKAAQVFIETEFTGEERHVRRINEINHYE